MFSGWVPAWIRCAGVAVLGAAAGLPAGVPEAEPVVADQPGLDGEAAEQGNVVLADRAQGELVHPDRIAHPGNARGPCGQPLIRARFAPRKAGQTLPTGVPPCPATEPASVL